MPNDVSLLAVFLCNLSMFHFRYFMSLVFLTLSLICRQELCCEIVILRREIVILRNNFLFAE